MRKNIFKKNKNDNHFFTFSSQGPMGPRGPAGPSGKAGSDVSVKQQFVCFFGPTTIKVLDENNLFHKCLVM